MPNPLFSNNRGEDVNRPSNPLNEADKAYHQNYNTFDFNRPHATTASYADITPFEAVDGVGDDILEFGSKHHIRTYTLQSPMLSDLYMKKSYYMVDMRAILPNNWEKIYREPAKGDDVPENGGANTWTQSLFVNTKNLVDALLNSSDSVWALPGFVNRVFKVFFLLEYIYSNASLFARFGQHYAPLFKSSVHDSFDKFIESFYREVSLQFPNLSMRLGNGQVLQIGYAIEDFAQYLELLRSGRGTVLLSNETEIINMRNLVKSLFDTVEFPTYFFPVNYSKLVAYQLICAEYFTNDKIDNIYTSQLYHQNQRSLYISALESNEFVDLCFSYNGVLTMYDSCSGYCFDNIFSKLVSLFEINTNDSLIDTCFGYLFNILAINKSLRYADYFLGARPEPYAPNMDMSAEVINGAVSAIDQTRSILAQRFANAVARTNRKFSDYLTDVVGGYDVPDVECPRWLASRTSKVSGFEVENTTSENQGNIVTLLNSTNSDYIYSVEAGSPCIVIGVVTFSMQRFYASSVDKLSFVKDRHDMYNKFMQFVGDQKVDSREYNSSLSEQSIFAYQIRHMEYKQRFPIASGAWLDFLPSMFVIADKSLPIEKDAYGNYNIDSFIIRNTNAEFDVFYSSLTNLGLCGRFHFQLIFDNICEAKRKMARQPSIL